jgi:hypothetical protein
MKLLCQEHVKRSGQYWKQDSEQYGLIEIQSIWEHLSVFWPRGVPGPTSKLSSRVLAQMGRRKTEHEGGGGRNGKGETRGLRVVLRPGRVRLQ